MERSAVSLTIIIGLSRIAGLCISPRTVADAGIPFSPVKVSEMVSAPKNSVNISLDVDAAKNSNPNVPSVARL